MATYAEPNASDTETPARPTIQASTLIRRPPADVFAAFTDPEVTTRFWFSKSSGRLEPGAAVRWDWEMYGASDVVRVTEFDQPERLVLTWDSDPALVTEFRFTAHREGTIVAVTESGFAGTTEEAFAYLSDSTGGYTTMLCGAKALLEYDIDLGAVHDKFPDAWV